MGNAFFHLPDLSPAIKSFAVEGTFCKMIMSNGVYDNTPLRFPCLEPFYEVLPGECIYIYEVNYGDFDIF